MPADPLLAVCDNTIPGSAPAQDRRVFDKITVVVAFHTEAAAFSVSLYVRHDRHP